MLNQRPRIESRPGLLVDDIPTRVREVLGRHLDDREACSTSLAGQSARRVLEELSGLHPDGSHGSGTLAILGRLIDRSPGGPDRSPGPVGPVEPPNVPGLVDLELVGRGGMGVVFRAREVGLDRPVAVKVLSPGSGISPSARARAIREALLMASLRHPNVVPVYRSGEVDGLPFLVMEWVGGGTLQARLEGRTLSPREAAATVRDLALAVAEAHALGIIHRDLKPDNVLIAPSPGRGPGFVPKLTDFGLARRGADDGVTESGIVMGTPGYMAPEQTGLDPKLGEVGPLTDIHGLGAILFACLIGRAPYAGDSSWGSILLAAKGAPASIRGLRRDVPRDLATIAEKCLQPSPSRRYRSSGELADDLGAFLQGRPISARPVSNPERWLKWARRHPTLAASLALLVSASIGGIAGTAYHVASIHAEQSRTKEALASATSARDRARAALGSLTDDAVRRMIRRGRALDEADRAFLRQVRSHYEGWALEPDPQAALKFRADGLGRIGEIFLAIDQNDEASKCAEAAIRDYDEALRRGSADRSVIEGRLSEMGKLHRVLGRMNRPVAAESVARELLSTLESLAREDPTRRLDRSWCFIRLANNLADQGRFEEAEAAIGAGLAGLERLRLDDPRDLATRTREVKAYFNSALCSLNAGRKDVTEARFRKMSGLAEAALDAFPGDAALQRLRVQALGGIVGQIWKERPAEALEVQRSRMELARDLVVRFPGRVESQNDVLFGAARSYEICALLGRPGDVEADLKLVIEDGTRLAEAEPAVFDSWRALVAAINALAGLFELTDRPRQAVEQYDRISATFAPWTKLPGRSDEVVPVLIRANRQSHRLLSWLGDHAGAARRLEAVLELGQAKDRPGVHLEIARERRLAGDHDGARLAAGRAASGPETAAEAAKLLAELDARPNGD